MPRVFSTNQEASGWTPQKLDSLRRVMLLTRHEIQRLRRSTQAIQVQDCLNLQFFARLRLEVQSCQEHHEKDLAMNCTFDNKASFEQLRAKSPRSLDFRSGQKWAIQKLLSADVAKSLWHSENMSVVACDLLCAEAEWWEANNHIPYYGILASTTCFGISCIRACPSNGLGVHGLPLIWPQERIDNEKTMRPTGKYSVSIDK